MMINSRRNQYLKDIRQLKRCKDDRALLEGPHLVAEAAELGLELAPILATPEFLGSAIARELVPKLPLAPLEIAAALLDEISDSDSPRGIVAGARLPSRELDTIPVLEKGVLVYAQGLQDPGNLGALARVVEASGAHGLCLSPGSVHPNHPRAMRASAGSLLRLPVVRNCQVQDLKAHLNPYPASWIALATRGGKDLYDFPLAGPTVLMLGAEGPGLTQEILHHAEHQLTIPLAPPVESLNATVAASLVLFEIRRQRR